MNYPTIIGIDVHMKTNAVAAIDKQNGTVTEAGLSSDPDELIRWIKENNFPKPVRAVYESGPTGFGLARALDKAGIKCVVAATAKLPYSKSRQKTDRADALWLARVFDSGMVHEVRIPTTEEESLRDLARLRTEICLDLRKAKQRVSSFLLLKGVGYDLTKNKWTVVFRKWSASLEFSEPMDTYVFREKLSEVHRLEERLCAVEGRIEGVIEGSEELAGRMARLMCIAGIGRITAFSFVCEIVDFTRFKNGAAFASYLGLVPRELSSGLTIARGAITKAGNAGLRCLAIEAVQHYSRDIRPKLSEDARVDPLVRQHAFKCSNRLLKRRRELKKRGKANNKAKTALARELAEWIYWIAIM